MALFDHSFFVNLNFYVQRRSGIQSKFLEVCGTSNKVPKAGRAYYSSQNDLQEKKRKEGGEVGILGSAGRVG